MSQKRLGILAGRGDLPWITARRAVASGEDVRIFHYISEPPPSDLLYITKPVILTKMFSSVLASMKRENVDRLILLGKATREILYNRPRFDLRTIWTLARMRNTSDYTIFEYFSKEFEKRGIKILPQTVYLQDMFLSEGRYGNRCSAKELEDISFGMHFAREINRLDIGQTVVVGGKSVLAVEGAEGTDRCIMRGGELFHGKGATVCKVAKINHDERFDLPTTGYSTLESMARSACRVLAIEAGRTFVLEPAAFIKKAQDLGITIVSINPENSDTRALKQLNKKEKKWGPYNG